MTIQLSKIQVAGGLVAAAVVLFTAGQIMHPGRTSTVAAAPVVEPATSETQASAVPMPRVDARAAKRQASLSVCHQDAQRLCGNIARGEGRVRCLVERQNDVSEACRGALAQRRADREHRRHATRESKS